MAVSNTLRRVKTTSWWSESRSLFGPLFQQESDGDVFKRDGVSIFHANALELYEKWPSPIAIISDGAYGLGLFPGDPCSPDAITEWYEPHIRSWSKYSTPQTTLWFWNSEQGWANVHPLLANHGWRYVNCHIWDKGISHVAGNCNTKTLRRFPVVTEVCVQYVKEARINGHSIRDWLRSEWERTKLPFSLTNVATGTKNAGTRKYFTKDRLWYFPPPSAFAKLVEYANSHGDPAEVPFFSMDGKRPLTEDEWAAMRSKFSCKPGITNVWREPPLSGSERIKFGSRSIHLNQKPLKLIELIVEASSDEGDVIWEPFGGLCTVAVAAYKQRRSCASAEINRSYYELALQRLQNVQ